MEYDTETALSLPPLFVSPSHSSMPDPHYMTLGEVRSLLKRVSYMPGYTLTAYGRKGGKVRVTARNTAADARRPERQKRLFAAFYVDQWDTPETFHRRLFEFLCSIATHEVAEWFRVDGVLLYDPHAAPRSAPF
jgi:hypothetical protein